MDEHDESQVHAVAERLVTQFPRDRARVEERVRAAYEEWSDAPVRTFVPIMVERRVRHELARTR